MYIRISKHHKNMNYTFTIEVQPYVAEWAVKHLGNPVEFPRDSPENRLIKRFIERQPANLAPQLTGNLQIKIPMSKEKDPRCGWFYMPASAMPVIRESLYSLFVQNLWAELANVDMYGCELTQLIYAWLEKHGISECHWECIRQKYYRLRKQYAEKGIKLKCY